MVRHQKRLDEIDKRNIKSVTNVALIGHALGVQNHIKAGVLGSSEIGIKLNENKKIIHEIL